MDTVEFLRSVLPWEVEGFCSVHWHLPGQDFRGRSLATLEEVMEFLAGFGTKANLYFCLSRHRGRRTREYALAVKSLWLDVDVEEDEEKNQGKKYRSLDEAVTAIFGFCQAMGIPFPSAMVGSGGGLHVYWFSDIALTVEEWEVFAKALKAAVQAAQLKVDLAVIADVTRVLRIPIQGSKNYKFDPPRPVRFVVKVACFGTKYNFDEAFGKLVEGKFDVGAAPDDEFGAGLEGQDLPPLPFPPIAAECAWLRNAHETGGKELDNPQWNLTTLVAVFLEGGHDLAHQMASAHPDYSYGETEKLWLRKNREHDTKNLGWPRCRTIAGAGSRFCNECPHLASDKTPLHLGIGSLPEEEPSPSSSFAQTLRLPADYTTDNEDKICRKVKKGPITFKRKLLRCVISNPVPVDMGEGFGLCFTASMDLNRTKQVVLKHTEMAGERFIRALEDNSVKYVYDNRKLLMDLGMSWLERLHAEEASQSQDISFGWRYKDGKRIAFAYGGQIFTCDGKIEEHRIPPNDNLYRWYVPTGKIDHWFRAAKLLTDRKRPELDCILAVPFASPLITFLGNFYGGILSVWGDPGTAKSAAQQVAASVWGHPKQTRESLESTKKSVMIRLGRMKNLPSYWDDIQEEIKMEHLFHTMFVASQGTDAGRLTADVSYRERLEWQTIMVSCSNASLVDYVVKKQPSTTAGLRRVLEIELRANNDPTGMVDTLDAMQAFAELEHHYGGVGKEYVQLLTGAHDQVKAMVETKVKAFRDEVKGVADESYWWGMASTLIVGAQLACQLGAELDVKRMEDFLLGIFQKNRELRTGEATEGGSKTNTEAALAEFLNFYIGGKYCIWTNIRSEGGRSGVYPIVLCEPLEGRPVYVHIVVNERRVMISRKEFRKFLQKQNIQTRPVIDGLVKYFYAKEEKRTLAAGTKWAVMQENIIDVYVKENETDLEDLINAHGRSQCDDWQGL